MKSHQIYTNKIFYTLFLEGLNVLIVVITSNRGLCGAFNSNIIKKVQSLISGTLKENKVNLITIGKKGTDFYSKKNLIFSSHDEIYDNVAEIAQKIIDSFSEGLFDKVLLVYNQFKNAATQLIKAEGFLPLEKEISEQNAFMG